MTDAKSVEPDAPPYGRDYWGREGASGSGHSRAQSTTLGFVFVFSLITLTIGSIYAVGFAGLEDAQSGERINNMERAFSVLNDNMEDITRNKAPSRATEIKLAGGQLSITETTTITVNATDKGNVSNASVLAVTLRPISYTDDGTAIAYSSGAVLRDEAQGGVMVSQPDWLIDDRQSVLPLVITKQAGNRTTFGGSSTVLVVANRGSGGVQELSPGESSGNATVVNVTVNSPYIDAWQQYFEQQGLTAVDGNTADSDGDGVGDVTYQFETQRLYIPQVGVEIQFKP